MIRTEEIKFYKDIDDVLTQLKSENVIYLSEKIREGMYSLQLIPGALSVMMYTCYCEEYKGVIAPQKKLREAGYLCNCLEFPLAVGKAYSKKYFENLKAYISRNASNQKNVEEYRLMNIHVKFKNLKEEMGIVSMS